MKFSIVRLINKASAKYSKIDLFNRTRYRLTIFYSCLLMAFLILFMIICYSVFFTIISNEQKQETAELASQIILNNRGQFKELIKQNVKTNKVMQINSADQAVFFCYLFDRNKNYIVGMDKYNTLHKELLININKINIGTNDIKHMNIEYQDKNIYLDFTKQLIYEKGQYIGMILIGRDLTFYYNTLNRLIFILLGLSVVFLVIASFIGYYMAKRAMVPVIEAYEKQKEFVADASHELRTPLSVIQSSIEVIAFEEKNNISEFSTSLLKDMKDEIKSMKKLVADLLSLARYDSKNYTLNYEEFDINPIANQILRTFKSLIESRNIKMTLDTTEPLIVWGDRDKLKQLLYILLDNAVKYSFNEGEIVISLSNMIINNEGYLCIKVKDTGIGISKEQYDRIFDRFYRVDKNRSRETGGTGLGLAIAKSIVETHRGKIEVQSIQDQGTEFKVLIPKEVNF